MSAAEVRNARAEWLQKRGWWWVYIPTQEGIYGGVCSLSHFALLERERESRRVHHPPHVFTRYGVESKLATLCLLGTKSNISFITHTLPQEQREFPSLHLRPPLYLSLSLSTTPFALYHSRLLLLAAAAAVFYTLKRRLRCYYKTHTQFTFPRTKVHDLTNFSTSMDDATLLLLSGNYSLIFSI